MAREGFRGGGSPTSGGRKANPRAQAIQRAAGGAKKGNPLSHSGNGTDFGRAILDGVNGLFGGGKGAPEIIPGRKIRLF